MSILIITAPLFILAGFIIAWMICTRITTRRVSERVGIDLRKIYLGQKQTDAERHKQELDNAEQNFMEQYHELQGQMKRIILPIERKCFPSTKRKFKTEQSAANYYRKLGVMKAVNQIATNGEYCTHIKDDDGNYYITFSIIKP